MCVPAAAWTPALFGADCEPECSGSLNPADGTTEFLPDHLLGIIRAAIPDDNDLKRRVRLLQSRIQRWKNKPRPIAGRNDD